MFTPQQIESITFGKATFGGYDMQQVDQILEPLTEDYVSLYKENALLKSKMRVLVGKLEEYRKNEASMKEAVQQAQNTCNQMVRDAEAKCAKMMAVAAPAAKSAAPAGDALVAAENARVSEARKVANTKIAEIQEQMRTCIQALERIKGANPVDAPAAQPVAPTAAVAPVAPAAEEKPAAPKATDSVVNEIAHNLEAIVGTTEDTAPKAAPQHPVNDTTTSKFANLHLQFGRNYDLGGK